MRWSNDVGVFSTDWNILVFPSQFETRISSHSRFGFGFGPGYGYGFGFDPSSSYAKQNSWVELRLAWPTIKKKGKKSGVSVCCLYFALLCYALHVSEDKRTIYIYNQTKTENDHRLLNCALRNKNTNLVSRTRKET